MSRSTRMKCVTIMGLAVGIAITAATSSNPDAPNGPRIGGDLAVEVNSLLGLKASRLESLAVELGPDGAVSTQVTFAGEPVTLELKPSTVRTADYQLIKQLPDGSLVNVEPGQERTLRGTVAEVPGAIVVGSLLEEGLYATVSFPDGEWYWVEPVGSRVAGAAADLHVVYHSDDVLPSGGSCGAVAALNRGVVPWIPPQPETAAGGGFEICEAELACDADVEYFNDYGSVAAVEARVNLVIDTMNIQYETEVGITHLITAIVVRTAEPDPYSTTDPGGLLGQFRSHWEIAHTNIQRDVAHLFTGKAIAGSVIGIAFLPGVCNGDLAYGLVESDYNGNFACATELSAHELGHNWGAPHCTCPGTTMHTPIQCGNTFAQTSINSITSYRDSLTCLDCTGPLVFSFPDGTPEIIHPVDGATIRVVVEAGSESPQPGTGVFHLSVNGGAFSSVAMNETAPNEYEAVFPSFTCADLLEYYFSAEAVNGEEDTEPPSAPTGSFAAVAAVGLTVVFADDFEIDQGWTVESIGSTEGQWERVDPLSNGICDRGNPGSDADGTGVCYVTDNNSNTCDSDVDSPGTFLTSPLMDASGDNSIITYWRWYSNTGNGLGANPFQDVFQVEISDLAGTTWVPLETVGPAGPEVDGGWVQKNFRVADFVDLTPFFRIRFIASDEEPGSIVEAGVDGVMLRTVDCPELSCPWDCDGSADGVVSVTDLLALLGQFDAESPANCTGGSCDFDGSGCVDVVDLLKMLSHYDPNGVGCP